MRESRAEQTWAADHAHHRGTLRRTLSARSKVELGIAEGSLLGSAMLVYMSPLAGLFLFAALFRVLFGSDLAALSGAVLGAWAGS